MEGSEAGFGELDVPGYGAQACLHLESTLLEGRGELEEVFTPGL